MSATTIELVRKAYALDLENVHILDEYTIAEIGKIYNGIGPDRFPDWLREIVTASAGLFEPAALIHDVEYHEGGTRSSSTLPTNASSGTVIRWSKTVTAGMTRAAIFG